jgi:hypothetical protein
MDSAAIGSMDNNRWHGAARRITAHLNWDERIEACAMSAPPSGVLAWLAAANREQHFGEMAMLLLMGCFLLLFALPASAILPFVLEGESVEARVVQGPERRGQDQGGAFGPKFTIRYEYTDEAGTVHAGEGRVRSADACAEGDLIPVRYLRSLPAKSQLEANVRSALPTFAFVIAGVLAMSAGIWRGGLGIRSINRQVSA